MPESELLAEVLETLDMVTAERLDIRAVTLSVNTLDCADRDLDRMAGALEAKVTRVGAHLVEAANEQERRFGVPIINRRIAVTPVAQVASPTSAEEYLPLALALDRAAHTLGVDFIGGFSALVQKGMTRSDRTLLRSMPRALAETSRLCGCVNVATTRAGVNMDAVALMGPLLLEAAERTRDRDGFAAAKWVTFANAPADNPFMAGAFHGEGEPDACINVGVSGPGVVRAVVERMQGASLNEVAEAIKQAAFKVTRCGELIGREVARALGVEFGVVDLSLAPTPEPGDSVANILEALGLERCGGPGTLAALALLNDAVKKGGVFASGSVGGLSGAFIPVSEDNGMIEAASLGALSLPTLMAMTAVCSVGLDMICVPGATPPETLSAIIADEMALGVVNNKTTAVRMVPVPGKRSGEWAEYGGLFGRSPIFEVSGFSPAGFIRRGGRIPAPLHSLTN